MWDYSYMWCCAMFNIHLSVPANFVLFVYSLTLTVFPWWISAFYFFYLFNFFFFPHTIVIVYATYFKGNLDILTLTSWYQHWHWKILFFPYKIFLKNKTWPMQLLRSFIWHQYHFATITHFSMIFFFIHPEASTVVVEKRLFKFLEYSFIRIPKK